MIPCLVAFAIGAMASSKESKRPRGSNEAVDLARRSREAHTANNKTIVKFWMDEEEGASQILVNHLASLGFDVSADVVKKAKKSEPKGAGQSPSFKTQAQRERLERLKQTTHQAALQEMQTPEGAQWVPKKYEVLQDLSLQLLITGCLSQIEPGSLSGANLRSMKTGGANACSKANVLLIVEFVTGCGATWEISAEMRHWPHLGAVLIAYSAMRGRRGFMSRLPSSRPPAQPACQLMIPSTSSHSLFRPLTPNPPHPRPSTLSLIRPYMPSCGGLGI